jgi:hypothetical protein
MQEMEERIAAQSELIATLRENCRLLERMHLSYNDDPNRKQRASYTSDTQTQDFSTKFHDQIGRSSSPQRQHPSTRAEEVAASEFLRFTAAAMSFGSKSSPPDRMDSHNHPNPLAAAASPPPPQRSMSPPAMRAAAAMPPPPPPPHTAAALADQQAAALIAALAELSESMEQLDAAVDADAGQTRDQSNP